MDDRIQFSDKGTESAASMSRETSSWLDNKKELLWSQMPLIALLVLCLIATILSDRFLSPININNILIQGAVMTVIAVGMTYVIIGGGFDLSVGSTVALSGIAATWVMLETNILFGLIAGISVGALVGLINGWIVTKLDVNPFIATLGTMVLVRGLTFVVTDGHPIVGDEGLPELFLDFALARFLGVPYLVWLPIVIVIIFSWGLHYTAFGIRVFATGGNTEAAYLAGINVKRIKTSTYVWCGTLAGVGGVMLASRLQSGQPTAGEFYELTAIAAVVLGGASLYGGSGKLYKSVIGVFIMIVLANALNLANVPSHWQQVAVGLVIIAAAAADRWRHR
jgi:ribose/xylose/arabinose/galactoside ABC-type transport system permease subunit